jgi:LDH2 family malate/lactate/ureidoglycolate dehydrogenase
LLGRDGKNSLDAIDLDEGGGVPIFGSWKGLCVQVIVEVLAGMLGGHTISPDVRRQRRDPGELQGTSQLFLALNPRHFGGPDLDHLVGRLRTTVCEAYDDPLGARFPDDLETTHERSRTWTDLPDSLANALGIDE